MGKSLDTANIHRTNFGLMAMLQRTTKPKVVAEQQTNICLKATSAQRTASGLMVVLQQTTTPRVVSSWHTDISPQVTST